MADIRIKDLATTATTTASDDFMAVDGAINGTRKLSAAAPAFLTSVTTPSLTSPAAIDLTLAGGSSGASLVLGQGANGKVSANPKGTGYFAVNESGANSSTFQTYLYGANALALVGVGADFTKGYIAAYLTAGFASAPLVLQSTGSNVLIGGTTDITGSGGLKVFGTTAGSAGAGALVVQGGISVGNTGSAASYFGGAATFAGNLTVGNSNTNQLLTIQSATAGLGQGAALVLKNNTTIMGYFGRSSYISSGGVNTDAPALGATTGLGLNFFVNETTNALALASTGAATFAGTVIAPAATASLAPLRIPHGTAPTSPTNGDMWTTTAGLFIRINGATVGPLS